MTTLPLALALFFSGFAALAAAMSRHGRQMVVTKPRVQLLRCIGVASLTGAISICGTIWNAARGTPIAFGLASIAALAVAFLLTFAPRSVKVLAISLPIVMTAASIWL